MYGEAEVQLHSLVTLALATGERSTSRSGRFIPRERIVRYTWNARMGEPQNRSGRSGGEKSFVSAGISWQPSHYADLNPVHNLRPCLILKGRVKSRLPFAGISRSSPYVPR
jgi:hypothetical protein